MNNLLSFKPINSLNDVKLLRKFYDSLKTEVRGLNSLGLEKKNFGDMLVPVLMSKVRAELKLNMSRSFEKELWDQGVHPISNTKFPEYSRFSRLLDTLGLCWN